MGVNLTCSHCREMPATCIGRYEDMKSRAPACDDCCAHGCEDGHCEPINCDDEEETVETRTLSDAELLALVTTKGEG